MPATVLIVDDERNIQLTLSRALSMEGYTVEVASGGREALEKITALPVEAVVMDVRMPDLDGLSVLEKARATRPPRRDHVGPRLARDHPERVQARRVRLPREADHREGEAPRRGQERARVPEPARGERPAAARGGPAGDRRQRRGHAEAPRARPAHRPLGGARPRDGRERHREGARRAGDP